MQWDLPLVLDAMGQERNITFPVVRVTASQEDSEEGDYNSHQFIHKYFSQLTRRQILELWEVYRADFMLFDYSIDKYLEIVNQ